MSPLLKLFIAIETTSQYSKISQQEIVVLQGAFTRINTLNALGICSAGYVEYKEHGLLNIEELSYEAVDIFMQYYEDGFLSSAELDIIRYAMILWLSAMQRPIIAYTLWERAIRRQLWYSELIKIENQFEICHTENGESSVAHAVFWSIRDSIGVNN